MRDKGGSSRDIKKFIEILDKMYGLKILKSVVWKDHMVGYFLNSNYFVWFKDTKIDKDFPQMILSYDLGNIDKWLMSGNEGIDERVEAMKKINLDLNTYKVLVLEISEYIFRQRNENMRKKIMVILDKYPGTSIEDYRSIKDKLFELNIELNDLAKLDNIVRQMFVNDAMGQKLFNETTFEFDGIYKKEIEKNNKVHEIIEKIVNEVSIIGTPTGETSQNNNVLSVCSAKNKKGCSDLMYCVWDSKGKCKVVIDSQSKKKKLILRISEEIIKNDIIRNNILNHRVDTRIDPTKFVIRTFEKIMITPLRSLS
jgi:hypothetical protein